jgi:hypothetical protein
MIGVVVFFLDHTDTMVEFPKGILRFVLNCLVGVGVAFELFRQVVLIKEVQLLKVLLLN